MILLLIIIGIPCIIFTLAYIIANIFEDVQYALYVRKHSKRNKRFKGFLKALHFINTL